MRLALTFAAVALAAVGTQGGAVGPSAQAVSDRWQSPLTVEARAAPSCSAARGGVRIEAPSRGFRVPPLDTTIEVGDPAFSERFRHGMRVRLTAIPSGETRFVGWGGACSDNDDQCEVIVNRGRFVVANFCGSA